MAPAVAECRVLVTTDTDLGTILTLSGTSVVLLRGIGDDVATRSAAILDVAARVEHELATSERTRAETDGRCSGGRRLHVDGPPTLSGGSLPPTDPRCWLPVTSDGARAVAHLGRSALLGIAVVATVLGGLLAPTPPAAAQEACADVGVVFARGSGQQLGGSRESNRFVGQLERRLGPVALTAYELGAGEHGGARYPAVPVDWLFDPDEMRAGGTVGVGPDQLVGYRESVAQGSAELQAYLGSRPCEDQLLVLGGFSQGAQVVGGTLEDLPTDVRDRVAHVALFGDPRLHLPEGEGLLPPACRGRATSDWRRGSATCFVDNGILGARVPYLPDGLARRTGSWCDALDPICSNRPLQLLADALPGVDTSTHGDYADRYGAVDEAAREASEAISDRLADGAGIDVAPVPGTADGEPAVAFAQQLYVARPGEEVRFRAEVADGATPVAQYTWDLDADGVFERTTSDPTTTRTYDEPGRGRVGVRAITSSGRLLGTARARVVVDDDGAALTPGRPTDLRATRSGADVELAWQPPADGPRPDGYVLRTGGGMPVATGPADVLSVTVADLPAGVARLRLVAVNDVGEGPAAVVDVPPRAAPAPSPPGPPRGDPAALLASACPSGRWPADRFVDVPGTPNGRAIGCAAGWGITLGRGDGTFGPGEPMTRGQYAAFVARLLGRAGLRSDDARDRFDDDDGSPYEDALDRLAALGVLDGYADGTARPSTRVTRAQAAAIVVAAYAAAADARLPAADAPFVDVGPVHGDAIGRAWSAGLVAGLDDTTFGPSRHLRRGQMASIVMRLAGLLVVDGHAPLP